MFGSEEYYAQIQEEIYIKNRLEKIIETIIGHPIERLDRGVYIEEYKKKYDKEPREKSSEYNKKWRKTKKGKANQQRSNSKRRARRKEIIDTLTAKEWTEILEKYNYRCAYCNKKFSLHNKSTKDHVIPISKGGHNTKENIVPACRSCNSKKGAKSFYKRYIGEL